jgi:hypothetical protein
VAEIKIERKRRSILPWILGLILLALVIWGLVAMTNRSEAEAADRGTAARDAWRDDDTPPRLRQYAAAAGVPAGAIAETPVAAAEG